jgi:hypothetical protein
MLQDMAGGIRGSFAILVLHGFAEIVHGTAEVTSRVAKFLGAEKEEHDHEHDDQLPDTNTTDSHSCFSS